MATVPVPLKFTHALTPLESPAALTVPFRVMVVVDVLEPTLIFVTEVATPLVPMFTVLVVAASVAPLATLVVEAAVEVPRLAVAPDRVNVPEKLVVAPSMANC
jgi:hypothetical protein